MAKWNELKVKGRGRDVPGNAGRGKMLPGFGAPGATLRRRRAGATSVACEAVT